MREPDSGIGNTAPRLFSVKCRTFYTLGQGELLCKVVHVGKLIQKTLYEKGRTVTWFAHELCCTRTNVYKIFNKLLFRFP